MNVYARIRTSRVAKLLLLLLLSFLVLELFSKGVVYFVFDLGDGDYAHRYRHDPRLQMMTWTDGYTPHPYFGYESPGMRESESLLSQVGDGDFVIGILGGSVAQGFAQYSIRNRSHFDSLRKAIPALGEKNLHIVNLANGGYKQPQQFFVAAYFLENLDLVINIDGFNDATPSHFLPVYPLEFPVLSPKFYERASQGGMYAAFVRTARWVYVTMSRTPLRIPGLSRSSLYFLCWYNVRELVCRIVRASEAAYYAKEFAAHQSEALRNSSPKEFMEKRIAIWKKYTILEDDLVRKRSGKPIFFFLQPNQYLKDSKPFSEQEKQVAFDPLRFESRNEMMILLKDAVQDLGRSGVPILDLTAIFSNTEDTVYKDDCCHLNDLGNQIMADAIVSSLILSLAEGNPKRLRQ